MGYSMRKNKTYHRKKTVLLWVLCMGMMVGLAGRLVYLCVFRSVYYSEKADDLHERERGIKAARGRILDANGEVLAANRTVCTISVIHSQIEEPEAVIAMLVKELGIERDKVIFKAYEGEEDITYLCKGIKDEKVCCEDTYKAVWSERPYMDEYPQMGKVHPATGYVKAEIDGQEVFYQTVRTDMEEIWDVYQKEVLPDCRRYIEEKTGGKISADLQPFFHELRLDVTASEPDYATGSREDLISSLDALHEDMYFVGSDILKITV